MMDWITYAESSGIRMLTTIRPRLFAFTPWEFWPTMTHPISTGPLEGTNNKIKTMKRQAYGFRDHEFLTLKILGIHRQRSTL